MPDSEHSLEPAPVKPGLKLGVAGHVLFFGIISIGTLSLLVVYNPMKAYFRQFEKTSESIRQGAARLENISFADQLDLNYSIFEYEGISIPEFTILRSVTVGSAKSLAIPTEFIKNETLALQFFGYIHVQVTGTYRFYIETAQFTQVFIGPGNEAACTYDSSVKSKRLERKNYIHLKKGKHKFILNYFSNFGPHHLKVHFSTPDSQEKRLLDENDFKYYLGADKDIAARQAFRLANKVGPKGLAGFIYGTSDHTGKHVITHADNLDFAWTSLPKISFNRESRWSAHWLAKLAVPESGEYSFSVEPGVTAKLWVDGKLLINNLPGKSPLAQSIALNKGKRHTFELKYYSINTGGMCRLYWTRHGTLTAVIPPEAYFMDE